MTSDGGQAIGPRERRLGLPDEGGGPNVLPHVSLFAANRRT